MTDPLIVDASPVFRIDGEDRGELARDILRVEVEESVDGLKTLNARFVAVGPDQGQESEAILYMDGRILDFGKRLELAIGGEHNQRWIFDGYISALEFFYEEGEEPEVALSAEDKLMDLRMTRRMKTYEEMSDADIAEAIAGEHGLSADVDVDGPTYDRIQQWNMSDLAFLRERARLLQAEIWLSEDTLHFKSRDRRNGTSLTLVRGTDLLTVRVGADLSEQRTEVRVSGYDADQRDVIDESAGDDVVQSEISSGRSGPSVLQSAFGERVSHRVKEVPLDASEATDWARAEMLRRARRFVTVDGVTRGHPDLVVGSQLNLEQMGGPFDGEGYIVTRVRHTFTLGQGHRTQFEAERPNLGELS